MRDDQLAHYREKLVKLQARVMGNTQEAAGRLANQATTPDEISHVPTHPADQDSEGMETDMEVEANYEQTLEAIEGALARIDQGTYGHCIDCGADIPTGRLDVLPFVLRCVQCEEKQEREQG